MDHAPLQPRDYPILEFDPSRDAVIEPSKLLPAGKLPRRCVLCFFAEVIRSVCEEPGLPVLHEMRSEMGPHPMYGLDTPGGTVAVAHPGVGASLAGALLEECIALGASEFIACGGAGVLDSEIAPGKLIVPTSAVRDEGTSYHYAPPGREVEPSPEVVSAIERVLEAHGVEYILGKTWTTDAFYRETPAKVAARKAEGCLTVEMEAAAFFAVARFRGVRFGQILYGGDDVSGIDWDPRRWDRRAAARHALFDLAVEACLALRESLRGRCITPADLTPGPSLRSGPPPLR